MTLTWSVITLLVALVCTLVVVHSTSLPAAAVHRSSPPHRVLLDNEPLRNPCGSEMRQQAPAAFTITFTTNYYGSFTAACERIGFEDARKQEESLCRFLAPTLPEELR